MKTHMRYCGLCGSIVEPDHRNCKERGYPLDIRSIGARAKWTAMHGQKVIKRNLLLRGELQVLRHA